MEPEMVVFLMFGALFGLITYSNRHLFSEGTTTRSQGARDPADTRLMWVAMTCFLWPIFIVSGVYTAWYRSRRRARLSG